MSTPDNAIAVVGMAGKFPGANDVSAFWSNLRRGKESIVSLSEQELRDAGVSEKTLADPAYVRRAPLLDGIDEFDADFFGFPPLAAQVLDPQHRLFLQCAWHALEDAGCDPARFDGSIGVYGTSSPSGYLLHNLLSHRDPNAVLAEGLNFDQFSLFLQNDKDFLATRISHAFNLRGPSIAVQTACSSSLVAVHLACLSLLSAANATWHWPAGRRCASPTASVTGTRRDRWCRRSATAGPSTSEPTARSSAAVSRWWPSNRCRPPSTPGTAFTPSSADRRSTTTDRRKWGMRHPIRPLKPMSSRKPMRCPASIRRP